MSLKVLEEKEVMFKLKHGQIIRAEMTTKNIQTFKETVKKCKTAMCHRDGKIIRLDKKPQDEWAVINQVYFKDRHEIAFCVICRNCFIGIAEYFNNDNTVVIKKTK